MDLGLGEYNAQQTRRLALHGLQGSTHYAQFGLFIFLIPNEHLMITMGLRFKI